MTDIHESLTRGICLRINYVYR